MDIIAALGAASTSITAIKDLITGAFAARDAHITQAAVIEITDKLFEVQSKLSEVMAAVVEKDVIIARNSERIRELETKRAERARYELHELAPGRHVFAYRLKAPADLVEHPDEPSHFLCQPCFDAGRKVLLQARWERQSFTLTCPGCKEFFTGTR